VLSHLAARSSHRHTWSNTIIPPRIIARRRRRGEPVTREQLCIIHLLKGIGAANDFAPRMFAPYAKRCKARCSGISRPSRRKHRCKNPAQEPPDDSALSLNAKWPVGTEFRITRTARIGFA
jgi:hypothetical protein